MFKGKQTYMRLQKANHLLNTAINIVFPGIEGDRWVWWYFILLVNTSKTLQIKTAKKEMWLT